MSSSKVKAHEISMRSIVGMDRLSESLQTCCHLVAQERGKVHLDSIFRRPPGANIDKDIYGFRQDRSQIPKDYKRFPEGVEDFLPMFGELKVGRSDFTILIYIASNDANHARMRKLVGHAFSETALREQQPFVQEYVSELIAQLKSRVEKSPTTPLDLNEWLELLSFDVISDLTFGESLHGLEAGAKGDYIENIYMGCKMMPVILMGWDYTLVKWLIQLMFKLPSVRMAREGDAADTEAKVERRKARKDQARKDFMTYVRDHPHSFLLTTEPDLDPPIQ